MTLTAGIGVAAAAVPAGAAPPAAERPVTVSSQADFLAAVQRDLGLTAAEARDMLARQAEGSDAADLLAASLGDDYAGAWFDAETGDLVVAVTDAAKTREIRAAGAEPVLVEYSFDELTEVTAELGALTATDPAATPSDITSWLVEPENNQVVVTVLTGAAETTRELLAGYGDAVRVEETAHRPRLTSEYLDGGLGFRTRGGSCSVGFNAYNLSEMTTYFLTAGHCGSVGQMTSRNGLPIGRVVESWYPHYDDALVRNDYPEYWYQGPWIYNYLSNDLDSVFTINGYRDSPVGTVVCKSGQTTRFTCGQIIAKNETVVFEDGVTGYGLTRYSACVEPGDSGGPSVSNEGGRYFAEGIVSGAVLVWVGGRWRCLNYDRNGSAQNISYYQPITASMAYYTALGLTLWTG